MVTDAGGNRRVTGVVTADGREWAGQVILATGHSARDVYSSLMDRGIDLQPKGIAVGVRLEHPQELIDRLQYHSPQGLAFGSVNFVIGTRSSFFLLPENTMRKKSQSM